MPRNNIDYSVDIGGINDPSSPNYNLLADAEQIRGRQNASNLTFFGNAAVEAYKGYQRAELSKSIDDTLSNTVAGDYVGEGAKKTLEVLKPQWDTATKQLGVGMGAGDEELIGAAEAEMRRIQSAAKQGLISREEAISRIGREVKRYSVQTPGMAQEFRQMGADFTGISRIDIYGIHQGLTQQGRAERAAADMEKRRMEFIGDVAKHWGKDPTAVNEADINLYHASTLAKRATEEKKRRFEDAGYDRDTAGRVVREHASVLMAAPTTTIVSEFKKLAEANGFTGVDGSMDRTSYMRQAGAYEKVRAGLTGLIEEQRQATLNSFYASVQVAQSKGAPIDSKDITAAVDDINKKFDTFQTSIAKVEGANAFRAMAERSKWDIQIMNDEFMRKYPQLKIMGDNQQLFAAMIANDPKMTAQLKSVVQDIWKNAEELSAVARGFGDISKGKIPTAKDNEQAPPKERLVKFEEAWARFRKMATRTEELSEKDLDETVNWLTHMSREINPTDPRQMDKWNEAVSGDFWKKAASKLSPEKSIQVFEPFYARVRNSLFGPMSQLEELKRQVEDYNKQVKEFGADTELSIAAIPNQDGGAFSIVPKKVVPSKSKWLDSSSGVQMSPEERNNIAYLAKQRERIYSINKTIDTAIYSLSNLGGVVGKSHPVFDTRKQVQDVFLGTTKPVESTPVSMKVSPELQAERDKLASSYRAKERTPEQLKEDISAIKNELKTKGQVLSGTARDILKTELALLEGALRLHENQ